MAITYSKCNKPYTDEQVKRLKENSWLKSYDDITTEFNKQFNTNKSKSAISCTLYKYKISNGIKHVPKNSREHLIKIAKRNPIGTLMKDGDFLLIKYKDDIVGKRRMKDNYMPYHRYLYEQAYGKLKSNEEVIFIDGDRNNFDLSNLKKITHREAGIMAGRRWNNFYNKELTSCAIECIRLEEIIK